MFEVATDDVRLGGAIVDVDSANGRAIAIRRIMVSDRELDADASTNTP
jgi:hypothetical protein